MGNTLRILVIAAGLLVAVVGIVLLARPRPDPDELWREAQRNLQLGRIEEAGHAADRLARLRAPTDSDLMLQAQMAIARDQTDEALRILDRLPDSSSLLPQAKLLAGQLELRRGRMRFAEKSLLQALELDPGLIQARRELIYIHGYRSETERLEEQFRQLSELGALSANDAFLWSLSRGVQWTPEEIVEELSRAVDADPEDYRSRIALADALLELTRFEEAEAILAPLDPSDPDSRAGLGRLALERGDVASLQQLLEDAPNDHAEIAILRGKLALQRREPEAAMASFRTALKLRPNDRESLSGLAQAMNQSGRQDEAAGVIAQLNKVNELNNLLNELTTLDENRKADRYTELGRICEAIGFVPQARAWYQNAIRADPFDQEAQEALARIGRPPEETAQTEAGQ